MLHRALMFGSALAAVGTLSAVAHESNPAIMRSLVVPVGERVSVDVDYKMGYACDDPSILRASMITQKGHNWFVVEGVAPGRTWCRVGTDASVPSYLFDVAVVQYLVRDVMSRPASSVPFDRSLVAVARTFADAKIGALTVTDRFGALIGIVSYVDALRLLAH